MSYDIDDIKVVENGTNMQIVHPTTGEPLYDEENKPVTLELVGQDSDIYRKISNRITNKRAKMRPGRLTAERIESDTLEIIEACTTGWSNNLVLNGEQPQTAKEIYQRRKWLREQAEQHIHDRANYLGN